MGDKELKYKGGKAMRLTKKKALDISIELWEWMAETGR